MPAPVAHPHDFWTLEAIGPYDHEREEACVNLQIVDSIGVELTESLVADVAITEQSDAIEINRLMSRTIILITDDDCMSKADMMCSFNSMNNSRLWVLYFYHC